MTRSYIHTLDGITVVLNGRPHHIDKSDRIHNELLEAIRAGAADETIDSILNTVKRGLEAAIALTPFMQYSGGAVLYKGYPLHGYAVDKLLELIHKKLDPYPLAMFLEKLQSNPSQQTIEHLYTFLEYGRIPITKNGNFLVYKAVRKDYKDIHSGKFDNSIGATPEVPRSYVDDRREVTCSRGLHVCSFEYLPSFVHADGHVMLCEVNPADVVSIPSDYNNTKMRVCKYRVVGEVEGYYAREGAEDVLADQSVWEPEYVLFARVNDTDEWTEMDEGADLDALRADAEDILTEEDEHGNPWTEVKIVDSESVTVFRKFAK